MSAVASERACLSRQARYPIYADSSVPRDQEHALVGLLVCFAEQLIDLSIATEPGKVRSRQQAGVDEARRHQLRPIGERQHPAPQRMHQPLGGPYRGARDLDLLVVP